MSTEVQKPRLGQPRQSGRQLTGEPDAPYISDWLRFHPDGTVQVLSGKAEVGQGIRTSLAQAVAEELRLPLERVHLILGDTAHTPFDMGTFGSRTTPIMADRLHKVAASAREALVDRASSRLGIDRSELAASDGRVVHASTGRSLPYVELTDGGVLDERWSDDAPVTPPQQWTVAGKPAFRVDGRDIVTGRHHYASDLTRPGALVGAVLRPPAFNSTLVSVDTHAAERIHGVTVVHEGDFVGVAAPNRAVARQAIAAIHARWNTPEQVSDQNIFEYLKAHPAESTRPHWGGPPIFEIGSLEAGRAAGRTFEATYTVAYIAHAPLETRAALAEWEGEHLTVWTGTQVPFGVRTELAAAFDIPEGQVRVIVPDTGGAYGGKHSGDAAVEAARLAKAAGKPVRVRWSREEEFTWAYFRPAALIEVSSAVDAEGRITAWEYHNYNSGRAAMEPAYDIPNQKVAFHAADSPLRQGSYRALAATANHFGRESHIDELAHLAGMDPLAFRLKNLPDQSDERQARLSAVLLAAAERFGWASRKPVPGHGYGLSCGTEKGSFVATCAEVTVDPTNKKVRVVRVVEAFECGAIVNPEGLTNQIEGAVTQAIGGALLEKIEFADGKILSDRFSRYRVPRFSDAPEIEVVLVDRKDLPSTGAGETPIVGLAPAVANAIFDATGTRLRGMPLSLEAAQAD